ncbi:MAG: sialidase family protein [Clostridia bacterium]
MKILSDDCLFKNESESDSYYQCRIPGIVVTKKNTVLTYYEARKTRSDWAPMDVVLRRSENGGKTFSKPIVLAEGSNINKTINNPTMIVGSDNTVHLLYCVEYGVKSKGGGVFYAKSSDDGISFTAPKEISDVFLPLNATVIAIGPGHGICTKNGTLITAIWYVDKNKAENDTNHYPSYVSTLYSTDNGNTFKVGETIKSELKDLNESMVVELSSGDIMINMRAPNTGFRAISISKTGFSDWSETYLDKSLIDPTCFAGICKVSDKKIVFVNCCDKESRTHLTLKTSIDDGKTWDKGIIIYEKEAGYADVSLDNNGNIYIAYEIKSGFEYHISKLN